MTKGFGGLGGRTKSYDWAGHYDYNDRVVDYINEHYDTKECIDLLNEHSDYLRYKRDGYEPAGCNRIKKIMDIIKQKEIIAAIEDSPSVDEGKLGFNL